MENRLGYLVIAENLIIDSETKAYTPVKIFDTFIIPKDQPFRLHPSMYVVGRIYLPVTIGAAINATVRLIDSEGIEIQKADLRGTIEGDQGINLGAFFQLVKFEKIGTHSIRLDVAHAGKDYTFPPAHFFVRKAP